MVAPWTSSPRTAAGVPEPRRAGATGAPAGLSAAVWELDLTTGELTWSEGMTAGRGFIAVALVIFAAWSPLRALKPPMDPPWPWRRLPRNR